MLVTNDLRALDGASHPEMRGGGSKATSLNQFVLEATRLSPGAS